MRDRSYDIYAPVRLPDKRVAAFISASYHVSCCRSGVVLFEDGHLEQVDPRTVRRYARYHTLSSEWYLWEGRAEPQYLKRFAALQKAVNDYCALDIDTRVEMHRKVEGYVGLTGCYPWKETPR